MCKVKTCCFCFSLRTGTVAAIVVSIMSCGLTLAMAAFPIIHAAEGKEIQSLTILVITLYIFFSILLAVSTLFLFLSVLKNRAIYMELWLNCSLIFVFDHVAAAVQVLIMEDDYDFFVVSLIMAVTLLYFWIVVFNYRRCLAILGQCGNNGRGFSGA